MTAYPSESSLVVNATQQQLSAGDFESGVAIAPTQHEESKGGYDVAFESATRLELQYKAVYNKIKSRTFQYGTPQNGVKFPFNGTQAATLLGRQSSAGTAFYTLPVVFDGSGLGDILDSTVFVDVRGLANLSKTPDDFKEYSAFWVPVSGTKPTFSEVFLKDKTESRYSEPEAYDRIPGQYVYSWPAFRQLTRANILGVPIRVNGGMSFTDGYQRLMAFELRLLEQRFRQAIEEVSETEPANVGTTLESVIEDIVTQSKEVDVAIQQARQSKDERDAEIEALLERHRYLRNPEFNHERRWEAVETALTISAAEESDDEHPNMDYSGLDPRQGSHYRQYRYLTFGEKSEDEIEIPIGFA